MNPENEVPGDAGELEGRYANCFQVGHNAFEFVLDFGQYFPERQVVGLHTRIITHPIYAKVLLDLLQGSVARYEQTFGAIPREPGV